MGSSHSSSATAPTALTAQEFARQQTAGLVRKHDKKGEAAAAAGKPVVAALTKAKSHEESGGKKRHEKGNKGIAPKSSISKQSTSDLTTTTATTTNGSGSAPHIIKSLSSMTNKLVGEAKIIAGVAKDQSGNGISADGKSNVHSALHMCMKSVAKSSGQKASQQQQQQHQTSAGNKRAHLQPSAPDSDRDHNHNYAAAAPPLQLQRQAEDSLERRRKSLQDGDVFIYPRLYKDLNECRKCLRDNRICNCIEIEVEMSSDGSSGCSKEQNGATAAKDNKPDASDQAASEQTHKNSPLSGDQLMFAAKQSSDQSRETSCGGVNGCGEDEGTATRRRQASDDDDEMRRAIGHKGGIVVAATAPIEQALKLIRAPAADASASASLASGVCIGAPAASDDQSRDVNNNNDVPTKTAAPSRSVRQASAQQILSYSAKKSNASSGEARVVAANSLQPSDCETANGPRATSTVCVGSSSRGIKGSDELSDECRSDESAPSARQTSLSAETGTIVSGSTILSVSQARSLSPTRFEAKVITISIGSSPTRRQQQGLAESSSKDRDADGNCAGAAESDCIINRNSCNNSNSSNNSNDNVDSKDAAAQREPHTSIVSIHTRRRKLGATKLESRKAIYDDETDADAGAAAGHQIESNHASEADDPGARLSVCSSLVPLKHSHAIGAGDLAPASPSLLPGGQLLVSAPITIRDPLTYTGKDSGFSDGVLDYSPILSSVRDYIKNMNTELQVQTPVVVSTPSNLSESCMGGGAGDDSDGAADIVVAAPSSVAATRSLLAGSSHPLALEGPIQVVTSASTGHMVSSKFTAASLPAAAAAAAAAGATKKPVHAPGGSGRVGAAAAAAAAEHELVVVESTPKKSIFDGASKDEILEYLEDARERVPDILMAADDVMVISENELIVVNQLEPDLPATPISIVETSEEVVGGIKVTGSETVLGIASAANCLSQAARNQGSILADSCQQHESLTHPDKLRQHLEQMYQTSQLAAAAAASEAKTDEQNLEATAREADASEPRQRPGDLLCASPDLRDGGGRDSSSKYSPEAGLDSPDFRQMLGRERGEQNVESPSDTAASSSSRNKINNKKADELQISSPNSNSISHETNISSALVAQHCAPIGASLLNFAGPIYAGRRNSISDSLSQTSVTSSREGAMQILALRKKRYTANRNSLSSPSSSPPSSTSPSSSSSSNQTSGNCSAATSFYASSSLSCSSPLLNGLHNGTFTSSNSPAFNQSVLAPAPISESAIIPGGYAPLTADLTQKMFDNYDLQLPGQQNEQNLPISSRVTSLIDKSRDLLANSGDSSTFSSQDAQPASPSQIQTIELSNHHHFHQQMIKSHQVDRDDSGIGSEATVGGSLAANRLGSMTISGEPIESRGSAALAAERQLMNGRLGHAARSNSETGVHSILATNGRSDAQPISSITAAKLSRIDESSGASMKNPALGATPAMANNLPSVAKTSASSTARFSSPQPSSQQKGSIGGLGASSRGLHCHYNTLSRLNNYFMNRHPFSSSSDSTVEFQCLDCDQFIDVDQATIMNKTNELRLLRATDSKGRLDCAQGNGLGEVKEMTAEQLDRAYVAAMNGLPLCKTCEKKRIERKEIISEFVETELKYGRDLKIIHDEFHRPMQIAGLLSKDQINGVFLNLEELIMAHCKFANRLETAIREAHSIGDTDFNTVNIGGLFLDSAEMLNTFESYCIRQGAAACLLARLAKERELLRIFLRVSQMENTLLRRMNLAAFLMVPVQRVTKYPLLLNRLYKVTAYHHKDREALRDAQLKVELHLEHINQQTKGIGASNKIWRRISSLSAPISSRRGLMNAEDIGYIKLRKTAMDILKWNRDETQFIHSGKIHFAPLTEYLTRQKMKPLRYIPAHALLIVLGSPNWKYRPDLVKANLDSKLMTPTPGGNGIKEAALLLFREKNGRFIPCREPLLLSNCVLSADCSQYNNECPQNQPNISRQQNNQQTTNVVGQQQNSSHNSSTGSRKASPSYSSSISELPSVVGANSHSKHTELSGGGSLTGSIDSTTTNRSMSPKELCASGESRTGSLGGDVTLNSSLRSLLEDGSATHSIVVAQPGGGSPPALTAAHSSRSYSLVSALPRTTLTTTSSAMNLSKPITGTTSSNMTILNQLMTKVNNYHNRQPSSSSVAHQAKQATMPSADMQPCAKNRPVSPSVSVDVTGSSKSITTAAGSATGAAPIEHTQQQQPGLAYCGGSRSATATGSTSSSNGSSNSNSSINGRASSANGSADAGAGGQPNYNNYHHFHYNHHQPYGDYEESFEMHERVGKESMLLRADTPLKTRYWLQMLRYHAKDLGPWRLRRNGLPNIMMMRHNE